MGVYFSDRIKVLLAVTGIISIAGGLTAIMYIDALQAVIMIIGAFTLCLQCFSAANISSLSQFKQAYLKSTYDYHQLTGKSNTVHFQVERSIWTRYFYPNWTAILKRVKFIQKPDKNRIQHIQISLMRTNLTLIMG